MTEKADWEKAWEHRYQLSFAMRRGAIQCNDDNAIRIAGERASFEAGYLAATERAPAVPGVVTREHRQAALLVVYPGTNKSPAEELWLLTGESSDSGGSSVQIFLPRVAQAIADAEARGTSRVEELTAEVERLKAEPVLIPASVMAAHRQTYLKALEAVELVAAILAKDAGAETRNVHQFYAQAVVKLREGVTPESAAPPADEVAGLLGSDVPAIREVLHQYQFEHGGCLVDESLDRIEAFIRKAGQR